MEEPNELDNFQLGTTSRNLVELMCGFIFYSMAECKLVVCQNLDKCPFHPYKNK